MKNISATDLILFPELSHLRVLDVIDPKHSELIAPFLKLIGMDLDYPVQFIPCQHRNWQGKEVISYMLVGELECNESFLRSEWATAEDRVIAAGYRDLGKAQDMAKALSTARDYEGSGAVEGFPPDLANPDEDVIKMQIQVLADLLLAVRGSPYKQDGSRFTLSEHGMTEAPEKRRKKPASKLAK